MKEWDVFVSHASEDKDSVAVPLVDLLRRAGLQVWFDSDEIRLGDRLARRLDHGLAGSRYGVVIVSEAFLSKHWTREELDGLEAREEQGKQVILPVWHEIDKERIAEYSPRLANRVAVNTSQGLENVVAEILKKIGTGSASSPAGAIGLALSHRQREWHGLTGFPGSLPDLEFAEVKQRLVRSELDRHSVLVLALPYHCEFKDEVELNDIKDWVYDGGGGLFFLGYYFADKHHESNPGKLARKFGVAFSNDLVMPPGRTSREDCQDQAFEKPEEFVVGCRDLAGDDHPLASGVRELGMVSACSLTEWTRTPDFLVETPVSSVITPEGRANEQGYLLQIQAYPERQDSVPVLAAWQCGKGRLVVSGTWKLTTYDWKDNRVLVRNALNWLTGAT